MSVAFRCFHLFLNHMVIAPSISKCPAPPPLDLTCSHRFLCPSLAHCSKEPSIVADNGSFSSFIAASYELSSHRMHFVCYIQAILPVPDAFACSPPCIDRYFLVSLALPFTPPLPCCYIVHPAASLFFRRYPHASLLFGSLQ